MSEGRPFVAGRALATSLELLAKNVAIFLVTALAFFPAGATYWIYRHVPRAHTSSSGRAFLARLIATLVSQVLAKTFVTAAVFRILRREPARFAASLVLGLRRTPFVFATAIPLGVLEAAGFLLFLVPGLFVTVMFIAVVPVTVLEDRWGLAAMRRGAELTKGHRSRLLGVYVLLVIAGLVAGAAMKRLKDFQWLPDSWATLVLPVAWIWIVGTYEVVLCAVFYCRLRETLEGTEIRDVAAVFD